jgi:hypothetical protein
MIKARDLMHVLAGDEIGLQIAQPQKMLSTIAL